MTTTPIPEARGFAAALETYLAQGGGRRQDGGSSRGGFRFTDGKLKGMTLEQATAQAREMWKNAPDSVKEKYARMEEEMLAPSERGGGFAGPETFPIYQGGPGRMRPIGGSRPEPPIDPVAAAEEKAKAEAARKQRATDWVASEREKLAGREARGVPDVERRAFDRRQREVDAVEARYAGPSPIPRPEQVNRTVPTFQGPATLPNRRPSVDEQLQSNILGSPAERARIAAALEEGADLATASMGWDFASSAAAIDARDRAAKARREGRKRAAARRAGFGDEVDAKLEAEMAIRRRREETAEAAERHRRTVEIREAAGLPPTPPTPVKPPAAPPAAPTTRGPVPVSRSMPDGTRSMDESARNELLDAMADAGADLSPAANDSAGTRVLQNEAATSFAGPTTERATVGRSDLSGAKPGQVWIGYNADGSRKYADGDPSKGGTAPPADYDPRSGGRYAGPSPAMQSPGMTGMERSALANRPDIVAGRKRAAAETARRESVAETQAMVGRAREAMAPGYKGPAGGADFGQYAGPKVVRPTGKIVNRYVKRAPRALSVFRSR